MDEITFDTDPKARSLGRRIRERRCQLGMSQEVLALAIGTSQATVSRAEKGLAWLPTSSFLRLRVALGLTEDEFQAWMEVAA